MVALNDLLPHFQTVGSDLYDRGMVSICSGNLSVRLGTNLCITCSGSRLGYLTEKDLVITGIEKDDENTSIASSELAVHRAIYQATQATAVLHAHPTHTIVMSFAYKKVIPLDMEGRLLLSRIPVIGFGKEPQPGGYAIEIATALKGYPAAVVSGHGSFARGTTLEEACTTTTTLEESCRILYMMQNQKR